MSRRARLIRAVARRVAHQHRADLARGRPVLSPTLDRWQMARWWLSALAPGAPWLLTSVRRVRRWLWPPTGTDGDAATPRRVRL